MQKNTSAVNSNHSGSVVSGTGKTDWKRRDTAMIVAFSVLLFLAMTVQHKWITFVLMALAFVLCIGRKPLANFRDRLSVCVIGLVAYGIWNGVAAIYSRFGGTATIELYKIMGSFSLAIILLARFEKKHVRGLLWGFTGVSTLIGLVCLDMVSTQKLFTLFAKLLQLLGTNYLPLLKKLDTSRVQGIYNDANLVGSLLGLTMIVALYLTHTSEKRWQRMTASLLMGVSALTFFLAVSRGAILCFGLALLVWLAAEEKSTRTRLFFEMVVSAAVTLAASFVSTGYVGSGSIAPVLLSVVCGVAIGVLCESVVWPISRAISGHGKVVAIVIGSLAVAASIYAVAASLITGPAVIPKSGTFDRIVLLSAGDYTLSGDWTAGMEVRVMVQSEANVLMGERPIVYSGPIEGASFTVPVGTKTTTLQFYGEPGSELREVVLSNGQSLTLSHPLIPQLWEQRLGGLLSGRSIMLRTMLMRDGLTLFKQSPLIGHGLGSTEELYTSVQSFFYESKYVHNHLIQALSDMGIIGGIFLLMLMVGAIVLVIKCLKRDRNSLSAMFLACLVMMNAHGAMEISFSTMMFQCAAFMLVMLAVISCHEPWQFRKVAEKKSVRKAESVSKMSAGAAIGASMLCLVAFGWIMAAHEQAHHAMRTEQYSSYDAFMSSYEGYVRRDILDHEQAQLSYVGNAVMLNDPKYLDVAEKYVKALRTSGTYYACSGLAKHYYLPLGDLENLFAVSRDAIAHEASSKDSWNMQMEFYRTDVLNYVLQYAPEQGETYLAGVMALKEYLTEYTAGRLQEIRVYHANEVFLEKATELYESGSYDILSLIQLVEQS